LSLLAYINNGVGEFENLIGGIGPYDHNGNWRKHINALEKANKLFKDTEVYRKRIYLIE
jgi:hypothetical protein